MWKKSTKKSFFAAEIPPMLTSNLKKLTNCNLIKINLQTFLQKICLYYKAMIVKIVTFSIITRYNCKYFKGKWDNTFRQWILCGKATFLQKRSHPTMRLKNSSKVNPSSSNTIYLYITTTEKNLWSLVMDWQFTFNH